MRAMSHGTRLVLGLAAILAAAVLASCASSPSTNLASEWYEIGNGWFDQGAWAKAGTAYARAISIDPKLAAASYNLARALAESGDYPGAFKAIDGVLSVDAENIRALTARAWILYKSGDAKAALAAYEKVLALDEWAPDVLFNVSLLREAAGDLDGAIAGLKAYVEAKPEDEKTLVLYARALMGKGRGEEALLAYGKLGAQVKLEADDYVNLGKLQEEGRDFAKAIESYALAVAVDPKRSSAWFSLARLRLSQAEDGEGGLEALDKALEAGFADMDAAAALLAEPVLAERERVQEKLTAKGLVP